MYIESKSKGDVKMNKIECLNCNCEFELDGYYKDKLGHFTTCPECGNNVSIDLNLMLVPNNSRSITSDGAVGIIWGNDADESEEFKNINYYFTSDEFTHMKVWSDNMEWLLRNEFEIVGNVSIGGM